METVPPPGTLTHEAVHWGSLEAPVEIRFSLQCCYLRQEVAARLGALNTSGLLDVKSKTLLRSSHLGIVGIIFILKRFSICPYFPPNTFYQQITFSCPDK